MTTVVALKMLGAFLIGAIPFAVVAMLGSGIDIRKVGSGNPGFNNVLRVDKKRAVLALIGDMGKGFFAVWLFLEPEAAVSQGWLYGYAVVFGHCFSPFLRFKGGKGVATSAGVMLALFPSSALVALLFFAVLRLLGSRRKWPEAGMIGSLATWVFFVLLMFVDHGPQQMFYAILMTLFLGWRHQQIFRNLFSN